MIGEPLERAQALAGRPGRVVLGIAGAPGAGKSTFAAYLASQIRGSVVLPLDGFHRPTSELRRRGWVAERGSPRTFDVDAYLAALRGLRTGAVVSAPAFDRSAEEPVPGAIVVPVHATLVITEGNYLLLAEDPWWQVRALLDEAWCLECDEAVRVRRLVARHVAFGRSHLEAQRRVRVGVDARNARLVAASCERADLVVRMSLPDGA